MGNVQQQFSSVVGPNSPLRVMNEDTFLGVLKYLAVEDYVHFTLLSRSFNQFFGLNNYLWAQMCDVLSKRPLALHDYSVLPDITNLENSVAKILLAAFPGQRLIVNNDPLRPCNILNVLDKQLVSQFNFKEAIKRYYIHLLQLQSLQAQIQHYIAGTISYYDVQVKEYDGQFKDVWVKADLKKPHAHDFYYYVNFGVSPQKLEKMQQKPHKDEEEIEGAPITSFLSEFAGRLVIYQNSDVEPQRRPRIWSRQ
jgi:hypothetical protein